MIELVRDLRTINVLAKFENDPWKIMDVRVLTGLVCPAARPPVRPPARPPARGTTIPRSLKGCGVKSVNKCNFFSQMFWIITKGMKITEKQICEDQIVTFKQSHILLYQGLLFLTRSTCVIVDARSHTCKSHDFIPRYDIMACKFIQHIKLAKLCKS